MTLHGSEISTLQTGVVIAGSGGAGLRAAIGARQAGVPVLVLSRGRPDRSGATLLAGANISADIACDGGALSRLGLSDVLKDDTPEAWFRDLLREGFFLNNQKLVRLFTETAGDRVAELLEWGLTPLGMEGPRELAAAGSDILDTLYRRAKKLGAAFLSDTQITDIIVEDGQARGLMAVNILTGRILHINAGAVIIATGGAHNLFPSTSGSTDLRGEGQGAALRAGAKLVDMEMISFCPTVITEPLMYAGNILPYIFFTIGYGRLLNKYGKNFTQDYLSPAVEKLALNTEWNKMLLSYAIQKEIAAGRGTRRGGVYFSLDTHPAEIMEELYNDLPQLGKGVYADIMKPLKNGKALTVMPAAHYFEGGVQVDEKMQTGVPGLFAAGEVTGGTFGANRVSAATTEMLIQGAMAGQSAAKYAAAVPAGTASPKTIRDLRDVILSPLAASRKDGIRAILVLEHTQEVMGKALTVLRNGPALQAGLEEIRKIEEEEFPAIVPTEKTCLYNREWQISLTLYNAIGTAKAILVSAVERRESRGVHIREDHFYTDNKNYLHNHVIENSGLVIQKQRVEGADIPRAPERESYPAYIERVVAELEEEA
ncbi:MAG: FAD-binding protein [Treponema sp.]|nr:FAD-binding protein [Treponema sp.]